MTPSHNIAMQTSNDKGTPLRSLHWSGPAILDACPVQADYGHLLLLTNGGALHGVNLDTGTSTHLCTPELPALPAVEEERPYFRPTYRLYASSNGQTAAIVIDGGQHGVLVDAISGEVKLRLDGGDYHEDTVPFSACFVRFVGRDVFVHRTQWNRLDATDAATGASLTVREYEERKADNEAPPHYLDYFHGFLLSSPAGSRLFDDGWVWHPASVPRVWSVTDWLGTNPWESEDGASVVDLMVRQDWGTPVCWINEREIAIWGLTDWDSDEAAEKLDGLGLRIFDTTKEEQSGDVRWQMVSKGTRIYELFSDGVHLFVVTDTGTLVWDITTRTQIARLPDFVARLHDSARKTLLAFGSDKIAEVSVRSLQ